MTDREDTVCFVGNFTYTLDNKERVNFPARWRKIIPREAGECFVITKGFETCLYVYPTNYWQRFLQRYQDAFTSDREEDRKFAIWCLRDTNEIQLDNQSRLSLPRVLLQYAKIKKEIKIIGNGPRIELWSPEICDLFVGDDNSVFKRRVAEFASNRHPSPPPHPFPNYAPPPQNQPTMNQPNWQGYQQPSPGQTPPPYIVYPAGYQHLYYPLPPQGMLAPGSQPGPAGYPYPSTNRQASTPPPEGTPGSTDRPPSSPPPDENVTGNNR